MFVPSWMNEPQAERHKTGTLLEKPKNASRWRRLRAAQAFDVNRRESRGSGLENPPLTRAKQNPRDVEATRGFLG